MLGQKVKCFRTHAALSVEDLVPRNNFYRLVEAKLDLSFVGDLVKTHYSVVGRPSIDPVVFFKLQLIMFFEGIRSERKLMESVNLNLAQRWYIGYDLDEKVPDHSSLTRIRERYGLETFQRFFERIVELWCVLINLDVCHIQAATCVYPSLRTPCLIVGLSRSSRFLRVKT